MATVTGTTVLVKVGEYTYCARVAGNTVELFRDGVPAGTATWSGQTIEDFPETLSQDAHDRLDAAIRHNLLKAWRSRPDAPAREPPPRVVAPRGTVGADEGRTPDAGNAGQLGDRGRIARQGEKEVGTGGPGHDPSTGEVGGQAMKPDRRTTSGSGR